MNFSNTEITQSFLPIRSAQRGILGVVPISTQTFNGNETSISVGDLVFSIEKSPFHSTRITADRFHLFMMVIPVTEYQVRTGLYRTPNFIGVNDLIGYTPGYTIRGMTSQPGVIIDWITQFLIYGVPILGNVLASEPAEEEESDMRWEIEAPFSSSGECSFVDIDWMDTFVDNVEGSPPVSIDVQPPDDELFNSKVKCFVVGSVVEALVIPSQTPRTLRFVKTTTGSVEPMVGVFTLNVLRQDGSHFNISLELTIS